MKNKIEDLFCLIKQHKQKFKMVALPVIVGVAILFFWFNGNAKPIETESSEPVSIEEEKNEDETENLTGKIIYVDICGEVNTPGVYEVSEGTRLFQVIDLAGGLTDDADITNLNRAEEVYDGEKILVENESENEEFSQNTAVKANNNGKININYADSAELMTLPNIGPTKAQNIIDYRETNGKFKSIDELLYVNGIGSKTYEQLCDLICV